MMCAARARSAQQGGLADRPLSQARRKIRISGGGRCNFTNLHCSPANFISQNPHFCRSALGTLHPRDFGARGAPSDQVSRENAGATFLRRQRRQIIAMLKTGWIRAKVQWRQPSPVSSVLRKQRMDFAWRLPKGAVRSKHSSSPPANSPYRKSVPHRSASKSRSNSGWPWFRPKPALVPLVSARAARRFGELSGMSLDAEVSCRDGRFRGNLLLTHRGLSGPSILQISSYWQNGPAKDRFTSICCPAKRP